MALEINLAGARAASVVGFKCHKDPKPADWLQGYTLLSVHFALFAHRDFMQSIELCSGTHWQFSVHYRRTCEGTSLEQFEGGNVTCGKI